MINWKEMHGLHVISKLNEILNRWYGVEVFYSDSHGKIVSHQLEKDYEFKNHFLKIQMQLGLGHQYLQDDAESAIAALKNSKENHRIYESFFKHIKGVASPVTVEGEYLGTVLAYPFITDEITEEEKKELSKQLEECGANAADTQSAISHLRPLSGAAVGRLQELTELVSDEIVEFHEAISKREEKIQALNSELGNKYRYHTMIGKSKKMQNIYRLLEKISTSETSVFIQGENGTGKELVAKALHYYSPRKDHIFMAVNCSAFNDNLLDSELFGHVKGAFTGALKDKKGLFETANEGTLFLDEIGDTSLSMQVKLLRVLQEGTYLPVGATSPKQTDVRVVAATNKNIKEMMAKGEFREDLYYRINVIGVQLPPLRDRSEDIPILMEHFLKKKCDEMGQPMKSFAKECMEKIFDYHWPGNVRELENEVERLVVLAGEQKIINHDSLSPRILESTVATLQNIPNNVISINQKPLGINPRGKLKAALEEVEIMMIGEGLKRCHYNKSRLAKELGVSRASLIMKIDKYSLDKRNKAQAS